MTPDTRTGIGSGFPADHFYSPRAIQDTFRSKVELPPIPENEGYQYKEGREGEERLAFLIATRSDVIRVVVHPKFSTADMSGIDLSVDFTPKSGQVSVHIQSKVSRKGLAIWLEETPAWLEKHNLDMSVHESHVSRRLIPMVSGPSESDKRILKKFNYCNREIQERALFERSRNELVPVFAAGS